MKKISFLIFFVFLVTFHIQAQTAGNTGGVGISITISKCATLFLGGNVVSDSDALIVSAIHSNGVITVEINSTAVRPFSVRPKENPPAVIKIPVILRSNTQYELYLARENPVEINLLNSGKVGFSLANISRNNGVRTMTGTDVISSGFDGKSNLTLAGNNQTGLSEEKILSGSRISIGGNNLSTDNFLSAEVLIAVKPEDFPAGSHIGTYKLFIRTP